MAISQRQIPPSLIKFAAEKLATFYDSYNKITSQVIRADPFCPKDLIPNSVVGRAAGGNLIGCLTHFLNHTNAHNFDPMAVFGRLIFDIAEESPDFYAELEERLEKSGFRYVGEGIIELLALPLYEADYFLQILKQEKTAGISREFKRLEKNIATDPLNAALNAAAAVEAGCKFYLGDDNYRPTDTLKPLADKVLKRLNFSAVDSAGNLKAGLTTLCAAIEIFRNKYSAAHGRGTAELQHIETIPDAEIQLYIQIAQSVCLYIITQKQE